MKAVYYNGNNEFTVGACEPKAPAAGEVRLDVAYCGVCGTDIHIAHGAMDARVPSPMVIGHEMSGTVAELGEGVTDLSVGDPVVVRPLDSRAETPADRGYSHICKGLKFIGIDSPGAFQESWTVPATTIHRLPSGIDMKLAALVEPLAVACHDVRLGKVRTDEVAVVIGGGPIGMLVAMTAREVGARVVLSEINESRLEFARNLGFEAMSPAETDLPEWIHEQTDGSGADIVFEVSGAKPAALGMTDLLAIRGRIVVVAIYPNPVEINLFQFFWKELSLHGARVYEREDYDAAIDLIASGRLPLETLVTDVIGLDELPNRIVSDETARGMKTLVKCNPNL